MPNRRPMTASAVAARLLVSPSWFSLNWRRLVAEKKLPEPYRFGGAPRWDAAEIEPIAAARSWDKAPKPDPARPGPVALDGDPELARRSAQMEGLG